MAAPSPEAVPSPVAVATVPAEKPAPLAAATPAESPPSKSASAPPRKERAKRAAPAKTPTDVASNEPNTGAFGGLQFSSGGQPIGIDGDKASFDQKAHLVHYVGHVRVNNGDNRITSESLLIKFGGDNFHEVKEMIADGNVRISQGTRWATGDHAVLDQTRHTVTLTGSPVVHDGEDQIAGTKITVHLDTNQSDVENARAVIYPKNKSAAGASNDQSDTASAAAAPERSSQPPPVFQASPREETNP